MRNETKSFFGAAVAFTTEALTELKGRGFLYVGVNAFSREKRPDYMEPYYIVLAPMKELPAETEKKGIYEPVDSPMLADWANRPGEGIEVWILT